MASIRKGGGTCEADLKFSIIDMVRWENTELFLGKCARCGAKYFAQ